MVNFVFLVDLDGVNTDYLGKQGVRILAKVLMVLWQDRHEEVLLLLLISLIRNRLSCVLIRGMPPLAEVFSKDFVRVRVLLKGRRLSRNIS